MRVKSFFICLICCVVTFMVFTSQGIKSETVDDKLKHVSVTYFYVDACSSCESATENIEIIYAKAKEKGVILDIQMYNIFEQSSSELLYEYYDRYKVNQIDQEVPMIFVGGHYYNGPKDIESGIQLAITKVLKHDEKPQGVIGVNDEIKEAESLHERFKQVTPLTVILMGFVNGLNPCSLSMLLLLVSLVLMDERKALRIGLGFISGKTVTYMILGTVAYSFMGKINMDVYGPIVKAIFMFYVAVIAGTNIYDFYVSRKGDYKRISNQLPIRIRRVSHQIIRKFSKVSDGFAGLVGFGLGGLISATEFLCTGQLFLATLLYMGQSEGFQGKGLSYLIIYTLSFMVPALIIFILLLVTKRMIKITDQIRQYVPILKLATAVVMIFIGIMMLSL